MDIYCSCMHETVTCLATRLYSNYLSQVGCFLLLSRAIWFPWLELNFTKKRKKNAHRIAKILLSRNFRDINISRQVCLTAISPRKERKEPKFSSSAPSTPSINGWRAEWSYYFIIFYPGWIQGRISGNDAILVSSDYDLQYIHRTECPGVEEKYLGGAGVIWDQVLNKILG